MNGMNGYMNIARGSNMCQVATYNYYPTVTVTNSTTPTTTTPTTPRSPSPGANGYLGCFIDGIPRDLNKDTTSSNMTIKFCISRYNSYYYLYAGLLNGYYKTLIIYINIY